MACTRSFVHFSQGAALAMLLAGSSPSAAVYPLPSRNDGLTKAAVAAFVKATTTPSGHRFVAKEARIATFDQDGTLWVEYPMYSQMIYSLDRVPALVKAHPELAGQEPCATVMTGNMEKIAKLPMADLEKDKWVTVGHWVDSAGAMKLIEEAMAHGAN